MKSSLNSSHQPMPDSQRGVFVENEGKGRAPAPPLNTQPAKQRPQLLLDASKEFRIPLLLAELIYFRGYTTLQEIGEFLYPHLSMLPSPASMKGIDQAIRCFLAVYRAGKPVFIHGDYDVDGITSTSLLVAFFKELGIKAHYYIPNRLSERYGLSATSIDKLVASAEVSPEGGVLITVDCGISAREEVRYAKSLGLHVIITDHHEPPERLPEADAILDPKQPGCAFAYTALAGVGVAFYFVMALRKAFVTEGLLGSRQINLKKYLDLVALGTVADVVPLTGVNRILVRAGLEVLSAKDRLGIYSLCETAGIEKRDVLSEDIAYRLAPRINASGRLGEPKRGLELLLADTMEKARQSAEILEQMNFKRRELELEALHSIEQRCVEQIEAGRHGLVVYHQQCHPGVSGILASRITERFHRPAIIFTDDTSGPAKQYKGSGRSIEGINLFALLERCAGDILHFGGHAMAAGLTVTPEGFERFATRFDQEIAQSGAEFDAQRLHVDQLITDRNILTRQFAKALQLLQPFGEGNPEPIFLLKHEMLQAPREIKGHLMFQLPANGCVFPGIGFNLAEQSTGNGPVDLIFKLKRSWYRGTERDQVHAIQLTDV